jgi:hypothetical protein
MRYLLALFLLATGLFASAQTAPPAPKPEDVKSIDSILAALYGSITGPPGAKHDWDRLRSLFAADARMIGVGNSRSGKIFSRSFSVEDYIKSSGAFIEKTASTRRRSQERPINSQASPMSSAPTNLESCPQIRSPSLEGSTASSFGTTDRVGGSRRSIGRTKTPRTRCLPSTSTAGSE